MCEAQEQVSTSNEVELWREPPMKDGPSAARIFTVPGGIGISVNGMCAVRPVRFWHSLAETNYDLLAALRELMEQIECLDGVEYSRDVEPYKAEACWDDTIRRAQSAIAKATSAKIIEFPATALDELAGAGGTK